MGARAPRRPPPGAPPAKPDHVGRAGPLRRARFRGGRDRLPAGLARQRGASLGLRHGGRGRGREPRAPLPAHLAGIRLQEAAGGGRAAPVQPRPRLPQPRAGPAPPSRVHHARMVPGGRGLRDADARLRRPAAARRGRRRRGALHLARARGRPLRRARAPESRRSLRPPCRHRSARHGLPERRDRPRRPRGRRGAGWPAGRGGRFLGGPLQPRPRGEGRAGTRPRPPDDPLRVPDQRGGARPPEPGRPAGRRAVRALLLRRRARERLRRVD
ncbi:hypothetical protein NBEOAGPD_5313 [Methylobacterium gregans]|uniref:Uncharacterized protein n=1 Tax=Methylobacterium gregans TaxID=374424 RepID=A0AA37HU51_9HYPH|nr:hypothetical protein NBEOAGPD_5313 [Methylobacterium gregans]